MDGNSGITPGLYSKFLKSITLESLSNWEVGNLSNATHRRASSSLSSSLKEDDLENTGILRKKTDFRDF